MDGRVEVHRFLGHFWTPIYGNPRVVRGRFALEEASGPTRRAQWDDALAYLEGAPGGPEGAVAVEYACLWGRVVGPEEPKPPQGPRKRWDDLSPQTKRGYKGRMRSAYGIGTHGWTGKRYRTEEDAARAEREFRQFYESADDLRFLRRHATQEQARVNWGQARLVGGGRIRRGSAPAFVTTWRVV